GRLRRRDDGRRAVSGIAPGPGTIARLFYHTGRDDDHRDAAPSPPPAALSWGADRTLRRTRGRTLLHRCAGIRAPDRKAAVEPAGQRAGERAARGRLSDRLEPLRQRRLLYVPGGPASSDPHRGQGAAVDAEGPARRGAALVLRRRRRGAGGPRGAV